MGTFLGSHGDGQALKWEVKGTWKFEESKNPVPYNGLDFDPDLRILCPSILTFFREADRRNSSTPPRFCL